MHEPVMSISILITFRSRPFALFANLETLAGVFPKELLLKIQACGGEKHAPLFNTNLIVLPVSSTIVLPVGGMTDR